MQEEFVQLFTIFSKKLDNLYNSSDKENVIYCRKTKNATSPQLLGIRRIKVTSYFEIEKKASEKNRVAGHFKIKERVIKRIELLGTLK